MSHQQLMKRLLDQDGAFGGKVRGRSEGSTETERWIGALRIQQIGICCDPAVRCLCASRESPRHKHLSSRICGKMFKTRGKTEKTLRIFITEINRRSHIIWKELVESFTFFSCT